MTKIYRVEFGTESYHDGRGGFDGGFDTIKRFGDKKSAEAFVKNAETVLELMDEAGAIRYNGEFVIETEELG